MRHPPPAITAGWPTPNSIDPDTHGRTLVIVNATTLLLALVSIGLRLYAHVTIVKTPGWDDFLMAIAAVNCCGVTACVVLASELYGWNLHVWDLSPLQQMQGRKVSIAAQTVFLFASSSSKLSILTHYLRIAVVGSHFRKATLAMFIVVVATMITFLSLLWAQCAPITGYWNLSSNSASCIPEGPPLLAQAIVTELIDLIVYVLPMPTLWVLKLPLTQRISLMALFGLGAVVIVAACMRAYWVWYIEFATYDVTWCGSELWIWAAVEANLGVICGCAPAMKPLLQRYR
ncbi:uncharacterized protein B0I36DRAFT_225874, partial [Microdochium trichocladiopsis]